MVRQWRTSIYDFYADRRRNKLNIAPSAKIEGGHNHEKKKPTDYYPMLFALVIFASLILR
jgi:hypothetical protein